MEIDEDVLNELIVYQNDIKGSLYIKSYTIKFDTIYIVSEIGYQTYNFIIPVPSYKKYNRDTKLKKIL